MGRMRYAQFTRTGRDYGYIEGVQACDTMENFANFRQYIARSWKITNAEMKKFHIHDQNRICNGRGDINPKQWEGLVSIQQDLETDSDTVYCICFDDKKKEKSSPIIIHDSKESFHTAESEVQSESLSLDSFPPGITFVPSRRSVSSSTMTADPRSEPSTVSLKKKRPSQYSLRERMMKSLRLEDNGRSSVHSESSDGGTQDSADINQMVNEAEVENRVTPNNNDHREVSEDRAIRNTQLHDGKTAKYQAGVLVDRTETAVFVLAEPKRLRHLILEDDTKGNALGRKAKFIQVKGHKVTYRGIFEKYQDDRPGLHTKLRSLRSELEEGDRSEDQQDTGDDSARDSDHLAESRYEERPRVILADAIGRSPSRNDGHALTPPPRIRALPIRIPRLMQDSEDHGEKTDAPQVEVHITFFKFSGLSAPRDELIELQERQCRVTDRIQDVLDRAKLILGKKTSFHGLHIETASIVNVKPSVHITEVWERQRNLEYYLPRDAGGTRYELDVETTWTWTGDLSQESRDSA